MHDWFVLFTMSSPIWMKWKIPLLPRRGYDFQVLSSPNHASYLCTSLNNVHLNKWQLEKRFMTWLVKKVACQSWSVDSSTVCHFEQGRRTNLWTAPLFSFYLWTQQVADQRGFTMKLLSCPQNGIEHRRPLFSSDRLPLATPVMMEILVSSW